MMRTHRLASKIYRGITSPLRLLPDFVIIGGQKCGTSSLYNYLVEHPEIAPAFKKELHFFDRNGGKGNILRYRAYFPTSLYKRRVEWTRSSDLITGEATPYYLFYPLAPERVRDVIPRAKLIALLRDPVDRAYSHYHHEVRRENEKLSFEEAIEREAERLDGERERILRGGNYDSFSHRKHSYLSRSIYVDQLQNWGRSFPGEQLLVLKSEDLFADPAAIVGQTLDFLGLSSSLEREEYRKGNKGSYLKMDPAIRRQLADYFEPHNERLYEYLGRDFGWDR